MKTFLRFFVLAGLFLNTASAQLALVSSENVAPGVFTYTFERATNVNFVWRISTNVGFIDLQSAAVLEVYNPPGWAHTVNSNSLITWTVTNAAAFINEPITFTVISCLPGVREYPETDPAGIPSGLIIGEAYELPGLTNSAGFSFQYFSYIGPAYPELTIQRSSTNVVLSWPSEAQAFSVQSTPSVSAPVVWSNVTNTPALVGSDLVITLPVDKVREFFRLVGPCSL